MSVQQQLHQPRRTALPAPRPILLVDDDDALAEVLAEQITWGGEFSVTRATTVAEAEARLADPDARYDALLVDVGLPDGDGRELCARRRAQGFNRPILMLTGRDDEAAMVHGLALGANDWVRKPYRAAELQARLRAQLRVFDDSVHAVFDIGPYHFRVGMRVLMEPGGRRRAWLTEKEVQLIKSLHRARGQVVAREVLFQEVWGGRAIVTSHTLETHVYRVRRKIEVDPARPRLLLAAEGGYRLATA